MGFGVLRGCGEDASPYGKAKGEGSFLKWGTPFLQKAGRERLCVREVSGRPAEQPRSKRIKFKS